MPSSSLSKRAKDLYDLLIRLSTLNPGQRIMILTKKTAPFLKWIAVPFAKLIPGCALDEEGLIVWVEIPDGELKVSGEVLGIDMGVNKLISDSNGEHYGREFKAIRDKIKRRKPGSKGKRRAREE